MSAFEVDLSDQPTPTTDSNGTIRWCLPNGQLHREDGPAVELSDCSKYWYQNDKCHREDGPAVEWYNGHKEWWINGEKLTEEQFNQRTHRASLQSLGFEVEPEGLFVPGDRVIVQDSFLDYPHGEIVAEDLELSSKADKYYLVRMDHDESILTYGDTDLKKESL